MASSPLTISRRNKSAIMAPVFTWRAFESGGTVMNRVLIGTEFLRTAPNWLHRRHGLVVVVERLEIRAYGHNGVTAARRLIW